MRPARMPAAAVPADAPATSGFTRRAVLTTLAGAGAAAFLGTGTASAHATRSVTVPLIARPSAETERLRLGQALRATEFQPTGQYVPAGTALHLDVLPHDGLVPTLWIGQWDYYGTVTEPRSYALKPGANTVTDPHGGPVYFSSKATASAPP